MSKLQEFIFEKKEEKMTPAQIRKAGEAALKDEQSKNRKEKKDKKKSDYTKYLEKQLEYKKQKYEDQKKQQLENLKKRKAEKHKSKAKEALRSIKTDTISATDKDPTAYSKALGNVGSLAKGVAVSSVHGIRALAAKKRQKKEEEAAKSKQQEKKEPGRPGRPKRDDGKSGGPKKGPKGPTSPAPEQKRLPPSGGTSGDSNANRMTLGRRARNNPELKKRLISMRGESYSDWRNELLIEKSLIIEVDDKNTKKKKEKIIDVMPSGKKNNYEMNPKITEGYEKDEEGGMAHNELSTMERAIKVLRKKIKSRDQQLPAWVQSKITRAVDAIDTVSDYMQSGGDKDIKEAKSASWTRKEGQRESGGLNKKGVESYRRENPGSNLKTAVTTKPSKLKKGGKAWKRRKSFCARMEGMKKRRTSKKTARDPDSRINKSLRAWNC